MIASDINPEEYNSYYKSYIDLVGAGDLLELLFKAQGTTPSFFNTIPKDKHTFRYAQGKWSILEIFQHLIDTERILAYRAFRFGRQDNTELQGFEQDDFINPSKANNKQLAQLRKEYDVTRQNTLTILQSIDDEFLSFIGKASGSPMSARAIAAIIVGHEKHHINIIKDLYL